MDRNIKHILKRRLKNKKNTIPGFLVIEPEKLSFKHESKSTKREATTKNVGKVDQKNKENKEGDFYLGMTFHMLARTLSIRQQK